MQVEVFSDVVCPWCYIGKRHLEQALTTFAHADKVEVRYRSYQLDPSTPRDATGTLADMLESKYGVSAAEADAMNERVTGVAAEAGLEYHLDLAHPANTVDAHRLLHFAAAHDRQAELKERLLAAYFTEGKRIGDHEVLGAEAETVGLDGGAARRVLAGDDFTDEVNADLALARTFGVTGVPFFVIDRTYGLSGAQPAEVLGEALEKAWLESHPLVMAGSSGSGSGHDAAPSDAGSCDDGVCRA